MDHPPQPPGTPGSADSERRIAFSDADPAGDADPTDRDDRGQDRDDRDQDRDDRGQDRDDRGQDHVGRGTARAERAGDPAGRSDVSRDDLDLGWGERYEADDARMEWLRAQRPPHHE